MAEYNKEVDKIWRANPTDKVLEMLEANKPVEEIIAEMEKEAQPSLLNPQAVTQQTHCDVCGVDVAANQLTMHVITKQHQEVVRAAMSNNPPTEIDKNADLFTDQEKKNSPAQTSELSLNQLRAAKQQSGQVLEVTKDLDVTPDKFTNGVDKSDPEIVDLDREDSSDPCIANGEDKPLRKQTADQDAAETSAEDVVQKGEDKASEQEPAGKKEPPDGYVRPEDNKIYCPIMKRSGDGRWYKTHAWVTKEHFEELLRLGKLPVGKEQDLAKLIGEQFGKDKGGLGKDKANLDVTPVQVTPGLVKVQGDTMAVAGKMMEKRLDNIYHSPWQDEQYEKALAVLEGAKYLPGSGPLMMMLAEMAVYLNTRLQEYRQIKSIMDVPLWVEYRYHQQFLATVDEIFKMSTTVARAKGMTTITIGSIIKAVNETIEDQELKLKLVTKLAKINELAAKRKESEE